MTDNVLQAMEAEMEPGTLAEEIAAAQETVDRLSTTAASTQHSMYSAQ